MTLIRINPEGNLTTQQAVNIMFANLQDQLSALHFKYAECVDDLDECNRKYHKCTKEMAHVGKGDTRYEYYELGATQCVESQKKLIRKLGKLHCKIALVKSLLVDVGGQTPGG